VRPTYRCHPPDLIGRPSIPETVVIDRKAAAYWVTRFREDFA
jgi:hypothetical protein